MNDGKHTAVLVVELNGTGASLGDGEATGLGLDVLDFVPSLLGDVLGHQRVGRLDGGELSRHDCQYCCCLVPCSWQSDSL